MNLNSLLLLRMRRVGFELEEEIAAVHDEKEDRSAYEEVLVS